MCGEHAGKTYLVAGASGGIGLCLSRKLAASGATVLLLARNRERLEQALRTLPPGNHAIIPFDVAKLADIAGLIDSLLVSYNKIDGCVYCVGNGDIARLRDLSYERLHAIMLTNFYAFIEFVRSLTQKKPKKQCMSIVGISSLASIAPEKYFTIYAASKAAMETAVCCLALELAIKNTTINTIRPGVVATSRLAHLNEFTGDIGTKIKESGFQPLGLIPPEDVADMALYLLSDTAKFITGAAIPINGGALC